MIKRVGTNDGAVDDLFAVMQQLRAFGSSQSALLSLDLSMAQMKALMCTLHHGGLTSRSLADRLHIGPSAVTPLVDKLVKHKLVKREDDPTDRRVIWIRPTTRAIELRERLHSASRAMMASLLADVSSSDLPHVRRGLAILAGVIKKREHP
jgi:DNA-binding MarR family transcriptional regulator